MSRFVINSVSDSDCNPFDRQERISWWSQEKIRQANVMVVGAGAIGNETLKNLALLGFRNVFILDFDTVSTSNLSRTVLFRPQDKGRKKAELAAERMRELCLAEDPRIDWFHGDVVWELGTGAFRAMDVVLGCLDNAETRFAINRQCWLAQTPWIDAGIYELAGAVSLFIPGKPPCYQCGATKEQLAAARLRYSCDDFKRDLIEQGKAPTVQVASAIASAIQVQEAVKLICGQEVAGGKKIYFQGKSNDFNLLNYPVNPKCEAHVTYTEVIPTGLNSEVRLRDFLEFVSREEFSGKNATLDLRGDRTFVVSAPCRLCGRSIELFKPNFRVFERELICADCLGKGDGAVFHGGAKKDKSIEPKTFSLKKTDERLLNMSLRELGIPPLHIIAVADSGKAYRYYELSADAQALFPSRFRRGC
jgi:adenylyltransferase/sulfurtransferase